MPYPESCPECGSQFRNTGTHFTARRNEVGRHVLLELGCQNTNRRYWWDFTAAQLAIDETRPAPALAMATAGARSTSTSSLAAASKVSSNLIGANGVNGSSVSRSSNGGYDSNGSSMPDGAIASNVANA